jgi:hypothetical protein
MQSRKDDDWCEVQMVGENGIVQMLGGNFEIEFSTRFHLISL